MNIIMQHSHIKYPDNYEVVTDGRILKALLKRGFIDGWDKNHKYVDYDDFRINRKTIYNNDKYIIEYFEGCFMPFVCKVININLNNKGGDDVK